MLALDERQQLMRLAHEHDDDRGAKDGDLRVWWIPQIPGEPFVRRVPNIDVAAALLDALAAYDAFQFIHRIKPDYCNAGGLSFFKAGEWTDWYDPETGDDFDDYRRRCAQPPSPPSSGETESTEGDAA